VEVTVDEGVTDGVIELSGVNEGVEGVAGVEVVLRGG
jgi:hypothetical protein